MEKAFKNFFQWVNQPSTATPLGARLLNTINNVINAIDDNVVTLDATKLNVSVANSMVKTIEINQKTGVIKVTQLDGTVYTWDFNLEKVPARFYLTEDAVLVMETDDGEMYSADLKKLIDTYIFVDSDTLAFSMTSETDGKHVSAEVKDGSITEAKLQPNFLADIKTESAKAKAEADRAEEQALMAQSYNDGSSGARPGEATDNSKYYSEQAKKYMDAAQIASELVVPEFYIDFATGCLMSRTEAQGIEFRIEDGCLIGRTV